MGDHSAFFYGTLMAPEVLYRVCFGSTKPEAWQVQGLKVQPAILHGYARRKVRYCDYPAIVRSSGATVRGTFVSGLTDGDIWRLDIFEGSQYERQKVSLKLLEQVGDDSGKGNVEGGEVEAEAYIWIENEAGLEGGEWDLAEFKREKMGRWIGEDDEYEEVDEAVQAQRPDPTGGRGITREALAAQKPPNPSSQDHNLAANVTTQPNDPSQISINDQGQAAPKALRKRSVVSSFICTVPDTEAGIRVALFKRSDKVRTYPGKWAPCSGSIDESDKSPLSAAWRELEEETTLDGSHLKLLRPGKPLTIVDEDIGTAWTVHPFAFVLEPNAKDIVIDWEHTEVQFVRPHEIPELDTVPDLLTSLSRCLVPVRVACGLQDLQHDRQSGARALAIKALNTLLTAVLVFTDSSHSTESQWQSVRMAGWHIAKHGRPAMGAAISSAILDALQRVPDQAEAFRDKKAFRAHAIQAIDKAIESRQRSLDAIAKNFVDHVTSSSLEPSFLCISASGTIKSCLVDLAASPDIRKLKVLALESRPAYEGAGFAGSLVRALQERGGKELTDKLEVGIGIDASMGKLVRQVDYVLLGADRISSQGDVLNKIGSFPAAACARAVSNPVRVVAVSELDKITSSPELDGEDDNEDIDEVFRAWPDDAIQDFSGARQATIRNWSFEWVPKGYIDDYVAETGVIGKEAIIQRSAHIQELEQNMFGDL